VVILSRGQLIFSPTSPAEGFDGQEHGGLVLDHVADADAGRVVDSKDQIDAAIEAPLLVLG
jgi:hypothetical protein